MQLIFNRISYGRRKTLLHIMNASAIYESSDNFDQPYKT